MLTLQAPGFPAGAQLDQAPDGCEARCRASPSIRDERLGQVRGIRATFVELVAGLLAGAIGRDLIHQVK
jgi:hypothetical protein